jgi:hypothetical protein
MSESPSKQTRDEERVLHCRLLEGDPTAPADLAEFYLESLVEWVQVKNPRIDPDLCTEAADEAILALIRNPVSYHLEKRRLEAYLRMSAQGDLRNLLRKQQKHYKNRKSWNVVELHDSHGKYLGVEDPPLLDRADGEAAIEMEVDDVERRVLELMQNGERRTSEYAKVCNVTHLPKKEQVLEVKRLKDRLKTRAKRAWRKK